MKLISILINLILYIKRFLIIRINGCAKVEIDEYGNEKWLNKEGHLHRRFGPALIRLGTSNGILARMEWHKDGELHAEGEPAIIMGTDTTYRLEWWQHDKLHRNNLPAIEIYSNYNYGNKDDVKLSHHKEYFVNGLRHRSNGPAYDSPFCKEWWNEGILLKELSVFKKTMEITFNSSANFAYIDMPIKKLTKLYRIGSVQSWIVNNLLLRVLYYLEFWLPK